MSEPQIHTTVRVEGELAKRLLLTEEKIEEMPGAEANRSQIVRDALDEYLEPLEELED